MARIQVDHHRFPQGAHLQARISSRQSQDSNLSSSKWHDCILRGVITRAPNTCPSYIFKEALLGQLPDFSVYSFPNASISSRLILCALADATWHSLMLSPSASTLTLLNFSSCGFNYLFNSGNCQAWTEILFFLNSQCTFEKHLLQSYILIF